MEKELQQIVETFSRQQRDKNLSINRRTFIDFCLKKYPNQDLSLGLVFTNELNNLHALQYIHLHKNNIPDAIFNISYPILHRLIQSKQIPVGYDGEINKILKELKFVQKQPKEERPEPVV